jgi:hypothetical protein
MKTPGLRSSVFCLLALVLLCVGCAQEGKSEGPKPAPLGTTITVTNSEIQVNNRNVLDVRCTLGSRRCTKEDLAALRTCRSSESHPVCSESLNLKIDRYDKEALNPRGFVVDQLKREMDKQLRSWLARESGAVPRGPRTVRLRLSPDIPFRMVFEIIYTTAKVGSRESGGFTDYSAGLLSTHFSAGERAGFHWGRERCVTVPRFSYAGGSSIWPSLFVTVGTTETSFYVREVGEEESIPDAFFDGDKQSPIAAARIPHKQYLRCGPAQQCGSCSGPSYTAPDLPEIHRQTVELTSAVQETGRRPKVAISAQSDVPAEHLVMVMDAVMLELGQDSFSDHCAYWAAATQAVGGEQPVTAGDCHDGRFEGAVLFVMEDP